MTLLWAIVYLMVGIFHGGDLPVLEFWNGWTIWLVIAVVVDIL